MSPGPTSGVMTLSPLALGGRPTPFLYWLSEHVARPALRPTFWTRTRTHTADEEASAAHGARCALTTVNAAGRAFVALHATRVVTTATTSAEPGARFTLVESYAYASWKPGADADVPVGCRRSYGSLEPCFAVIPHDAERRFLVAIPWMEKQQESDSDDYESDRHREREAAVHDRRIGRRRAVPEQRSEIPRQRNAHAHARPGARPPTNEALVLRGDCVAGPRLDLDAERSCRNPSPEVRDPFLVQGSKPEAERVVDAIHPE
jgi:hypothetical protein